MGCKLVPIDGIIAGTYALCIMFYIALGFWQVAIWTAVSLVPFLFLFIFMCLSSPHRSCFYWINFFWTLVCILGSGYVFFKAKTDVEQVMDLYPLCELIDKHR